LSLLNNLYKGLIKTSSRFSSEIKNIFSTKRKIDKSVLDELEELLISMDIGNKATRLIIDKLRDEQEAEYDIVKQRLIEEIESILNSAVHSLTLDKKPHVIMMCGVNGSGKTTTAGKLAYKYKKMGKSVMLVACDTFRAAASEQLDIWAKRSGCSIIIGKHGADSASVAYKAVNQAIKDNVDVVLIDTAGRLQNNINLMEELSKIHRVIKKLDDNAPHDVILVLDATVGQNAYSQLETFNKMVNVTGLIVTKLDGTAKGGVVIGLAQEYKVRLYAIGIGEGIEDLKEFTGKEFAKALME
jgi:fused signal recognition particle receptor